MNRLVTIKRIVFHHSLSDFGDANLIDDWHRQKGYKMIGYHFVITKFGVIEKGRSMKYQGAHAYRKNTDSIGVCFIGDFNKYPIKQVQIAAAAKLVFQLQALSKSIYIDFHVDSKKKVCPGVLFDRGHFKKRILKVCHLIEPSRNGWS
jgi:hypothetical protein